MTINRGGYYTITVYFTEEDRELRDSLTSMVARGEIRSVSMYIRETLRNHMKKEGKIHEAKAS